MSRIANYGLIILTKNIEEYANYYLTEKGMYIRMYGCSREPSLLPKYATDYVVHKEVVMKVYLDGVGSFLFEYKKVAYPTIPFRLGSYKFSKVKLTVEFVQELEHFHFGEMRFHRNDSLKKVVEHCKEANVHFEYAKFWDKDKEIFRNARNMTALKRRFKQKLTVKGGKGQTAQKKDEEEEAKKREEDARRLAQEAESWINNEEEERKKSIEEATKNAEEVAKNAEEAAKKTEEERKKKEDEEMKKKQKEDEGLRLIGSTTNQQTTEPIDIQ